MGTSVLDSLRAERETLVEEIEGLQAAEGFDPGDKTYSEARSRASAIDSKIKSIVEWEKSREGANAIDALQVRGRKQADQERRLEEAGLTLGELWVRSSQWQDYRDRPRGNSGLLTVPFDSLQTRAPIALGTYPGVIEKDRIRPTSTPPVPTPLLDLVPTIQVSSNAVEWVTYGADPVAAVVAELAQKPEATFTIGIQNVNLETIAHFVKYSRQFAQDGGDLVNYINGALVRGVRSKQEGIAEAALVASTIPAIASPPAQLYHGIRIAMAAVQAAGWANQAVLANPTDLAVFDIGIMSQTLNGPQLYSTVWGVPAVGIPTIPSGTAYVGEWSTAMVSLVRAGVTVYTTDSDISGSGATAASDFRANILTTLAEARSAALVQNPQAARKVSGTVVAPADAEENPGARSARRG